MARGSTATKAVADQKIGLLIHDVRNPFFADVARGVEDVASAAGFEVVLCNTDESADKESKYLERLADHGVRGVAIAPVRSALTYLDLLRDRGLPVVLVDRRSIDDQRCSVSVNGVKGGEFAGRHLLSLGHERIAFLTVSRGLQQATDRLTGLVNAVEGAGLDPEQTILQVDLPAVSSLAGEEAVRKIMSGRNPPTAIFCLNDTVALGAMRGLVLEGISVPDDVAVMGYDDVEHASALSPALSTIRQPKYGLGQVAGNLLLDEITNPDGHAHMQKEFIPELVVRASTSA